MLGRRAFFLFSFLFLFCTHSSHSKWRTRPWELKEIDYTRWRGVWGSGIILKDEMLWSSSARVEAVLKGLRKYLFHYIAYRDERHANFVRLLKTASACELVLRTRRAPVDLPRDLNSVVDELERLDSEATPEQRALIRSSISGLMYSALGNPTDPLAFPRTVWSVATQSKNIPALLDLQRLRMLFLNARLVGLLFEYAAKNQAIPHEVAKKKSIQTMVELLWSGLGLFQEQTLRPVQIAEWERASAAPVAAIKN